MRVGTTKRALWSRLPILGGDLRSWLDVGLYLGFTTYLVAALILGAVFLYYAISLFRGRDDGLPLRTFVFSIYYLMALFSALLVDHYLLLW